MSRPHEPARSEARSGLDDWSRLGSSLFILSDVGLACQVS
jgi:hypothetical protein